MKKPDTMKVAKLPITELRVKRLGLSNELFYNRARHAAKMTENSITVRNVGGNVEGNKDGLLKARGVIAEVGYTGKMQRGTRSKVGGIIQAWVNCLRTKGGAAFGGGIGEARKMVFVTLTLPAPQMHTDKEVKRDMLNRFLITIQRKHGATRNFWRAEPQKNGNIHFHVLLDVFIPHTELKKVWNEILDSSGYIEVYRENQNKHHGGTFKARPELYKTWPLASQLRAYAEGKKGNWSNPNTTDVHSLRKVKNCAAYVCKYVTKEGGARKIDGRIWGCTDALRQLSLPEFNCNDELIVLLNESVAYGEMKKIVHEHATTYAGDVVGFLTQYAPEALDAVNLYYADLCSWLMVRTDPRYKYFEHEQPITLDTNGNAL